MKNDLINTGKFTEREAEIIKDLASWTREIKNAYPLSMEEYLTLNRIIEVQTIYVILTDTYLGLYSDNAKEDRSLMWAMLRARGLE